MRRACIAAFVLCLSAPALVGDIVKFADGKSIEGIIRTEGTDFVVIEVFTGGTSTLMRIELRQVDSIIKQPYVPPKAAAAPKPPKGTAPRTPPAEAPADKAGAAARGPGYFVIPIQGEVGKEIAARQIERAMEAGLQSSRTILVFEIDSPGGLINECQKIVDLVAEHKDRRTIAFVKSAYSAAAIIALTCDEIYMADGASIGAATAVTIQRDQAQSASKMVEAPEKIQSVWRAVCRHAAEIGGHNPLLAEAMVDPDLQLRVVHKNGTKTVEQCMELEPKDFSEGRVVSTKGKLLTLTAKEAVDCGLAAGIAARRADLEKVAPDVAGWKPVSDRGEKLMATYRIAAKDAERQLKKLVDDLNKEFQEAVKDDPSTKTYYVDAQKRFTPASRKSWQAYSVNCYNHLLACERLLGRITLVGQDFPFLQKDAEHAQEIKSKIREVRENIKREASRRGV